MGVPAMLFKREAIGADAVLRPGARGARKLVVTELYEAKEQPASDVLWSPPGEGEKCQVQVMPNTEVAVFTQQATQDRHYHKRGTEMYIVMEGTMPIEIEGELHTLSAGDMIVVNPHAIHEVKSAGHAFLCRVVTVNCGGAQDKFVADGSA